MSLMTVASAVAAVAVILLGGAVAGALAGRGLVVAVSAVAAGFMGAGLAAGWRPALELSLLLCVVAGVALPGSPRQLVAMTVLAVATIVSHEMGRLSIDLRRPARLGPGVLRRFVLWMLGPGAVAVVVALVVAALDGRTVPTAAVPVALVLSALPVALPRLTATPSGRTARMVAMGPGGRSVLAGVVTLVVLASALLGATARHDIQGGLAPVPEVGFGGGADPVPDQSTGATAPADQSAPRSPGGGSYITLVVLILAAAVILLFVTGLRRRSIPLVQDAIDLVDDDPGLALVGPVDADLDDETVVLADEAVAALVADIAVDLRAEPDPGRAVRYAYARVERSLAEQGIERRPSESEPELLARALGVVGDQGRALAQLTALFERARFSDAPVPEAMRSDAIAALGQLRVGSEPAS